MDLTIACNFPILSSVQQSVTDLLSDNTIIEKIRKGDNSCFSVLISRHKDYAFTLALRVLKSREDAEEVAHDAFLKAFKALDSFRMDSKFTTWFYKIVVNMAISRGRKKKVTTEQIDVYNTGHYSTFDEVGSMQSVERKFFLNKAIGLLNEEESLLITLYYMEELQMDEVAQITGIDKNNLKVKIFRARKKLAGILAQLTKGEAQSLL